MSDDYKSILLKEIKVQLLVRKANRYGLTILPSKILDELLKIDFDIHNTSGGLVFEIDEIKEEYTVGDNGKISLVKQDHGHLYRFIERLIVKHRWHGFFGL